MSLDVHWNPDTSELIEKRNIPGPGVEFDIAYPSDVSPGRSFDLMSTVYEGTGTLTGIDVSMYEGFALTFTLAAIDGLSDPDPADTRLLVVGALIGPTAEGYMYGYRPETLSLGPNAPQVDTSATSIAPDVVNTIGFKAHLFEDTGWNPSGSLVTLRVAPTEGAVQIPEPGTFALAGLAAIVATRRR
jgi:hypothetical protein